MMNKTEIKGSNWLRRQGYQGFLFYCRQSPDFLTPDGKGFEIKLARNNTIVFFESQVQSLKGHPDVTIVVFDDTSDEPIALIPFREIPLKTSYWRNIHIRILDRYANPHIITRKCIICGNTYEKLNTSKIRYCEPCLWKQISKWGRRKSSGLKGRPPQ